MEKEITHQLPIIQKLLLAYRGSSSIITGIILILSLVACFSYLKDFDFREYYKLYLNTATTKGKITNAYYTGMHGEIGDDEGHYYINAYIYEYKVNGYLHKWKSYSRLSKLKVGSSVKVKYNIKSPQYSVIQNYNTLPNGNFKGVLVLIPLSCFLILLYHIFKAIKFYYIIRNGIITKGKITKKHLVYSGEYYDYYTLRYKYTLNNKSYILRLFTSNSSLYNKTSNQYLIIKSNKPQQALLLQNLAPSVAKYIKKNWI